MAMNQTDSRLATVEQITIDFEDFKQALTDNHLTDTDRQRNGNTVLRLLPPFESEMEAEQYFSRKMQRYDNNWDEKPVHIRPHLLFETGGSDFLRSAEYPTRGNQQHVLSDEEIDAAGGLDTVVEEARTLFWEELKYSLPSMADIGEATGYTSKTVEIEWVNVE